MFVKHLCFSVITWLCTASAWGTVTIYENQTGWEDAVNNDFTTIDFTGWPDWTIITTQYSSLGIQFTDGSDRIRNNPELFPNDGSGLYGAVSSITIEFSSPIYYLAHWYYAGSRLDLYYGGELIYTSPFFNPLGPPHHFVGFISTELFDEARIYAPNGGAINVDNLYFQSPIPAPGALTWLGLAALVRCRRRSK